MAMRGEFNGADGGASAGQGRGAAAAHCADLVRRGDPDRYLAASFAPSWLRPPLLALYAFNVELARAVEMASEPVLAQMRLAFWREGLAALSAGRPPAQPVLAALAEAAIDPVAIERLIDARERALAGPPATRDALMAGIDSGGGALMALALGIAGVTAPKALARDAARAFGLSGTLRAVAWHARAGRVTLPLDLLAAEGVTPEDVLALRSGPGLARIALALAEEARAHLRAARAARGAVPRAALSPLLVLRLAAADLARLRRLRYDLFDPRVGARGLGRVLGLMTGAALRRY